MPTSGEKRQGAGRAAPEAGSPMGSQGCVRYKERRREGQTVRDLVVRLRRCLSSSTGDGQSPQGGAGEHHDPRVTRAAPWGQSVGKEGSGETLRHCCVVQMRECGTGISVG